MSDETIETEKKKKPIKADSIAGALVEPTPKNQEFFSWLESLFYGVDQFPEKLEVRVVRGRDFATMGPRLREISYGPADSKPKKEDLVKLSNEILFRCQQDCDVQRKTVVYHVAAIHFSRGDAPYERFLLRFTPGPTYKHGIDGDREEEEDDSMEKRFSGQIMRHQEKMVELLGATFEGLIDRQDRMAERLANRNEQLEARLEKMFDHVERALSLESERKSKEKWDDLKIEGAKKSMEVLGTLAPPLIGQLLGGKTVGIAENSESKTLKTFVETLSPEQLDKVFGRYDESGNTLLKPGILAREQAQLFADIAMCRASTDRLDELLPDGPLAISLEQVQRLISEAGIEMLQIAPLKIIFDARQAKKKPQ